MKPGDKAEKAQDVEADNEDMSQYNFGPDHIPLRMDGRAVNPIPTSYSRGRRVVVIESPQSVLSSLA